MVAAQVSKQILEGKLFLNVRQGFLNLLSLISQVR